MLCLPLLDCHRPSLERQLFRCARLCRVIRCARASNRNQLLPLRRSSTSPKVLRSDLRRRPCVFGWTPARESGPALHAGPERHREIHTMQHGEQDGFKSWFSIGRCDAIQGLLLPSKCFEYWRSSASSTTMLPLVKTHCHSRLDPRPHDPKDGLPATSGWLVQAKASAPPPRMGGREHRWYPSMVLFVGPCPCHGPPASRPAM